MSFGLINNCNMQIKEFLDDMAEILEDTDPSLITATTDFKELDDWDSLTNLTIIALAKTKYGKNIVGREIRSCNSIQDLFNIIESK